MNRPDIAVAVPVKDEASRLSGFLEALGHQGYPLSILVLLNNCTDGSEEAAAHAAARLPEGVVAEIVRVDLPDALANAGTARRLAMDAAAASLEARGADPSRALLLTTDADATPPRGWVGANLAALAAGADCACGRIFGDPDEEALLPAPVRRRAARLTGFQNRMTRLEAQVDPIPHDPFPRHHDTLGASLGLTLAAYRAIGGCPPLPAREDLALVRAMRLGGFRVRRPVDVRMVVSARTEGRADGGMADAIRRWIDEETSGVPLRVEDPQASLRRFRRRAALRRLWVDRSEGLALDPSLTALLDSAPSADALVEAVLPNPLDPALTLTLDEALAFLDATPFVPPMDVAPLPAAAGAPVSVAA